MISNTIIEVVGWSLFHIQDYLNESYSTEDYSIIQWILVVLYIAIPAMQLVYFLFNSKVRKNKVKRRSYCLSIIIASFIFGITLYVMMTNDMFIVEQSEELFNGLEYFIYILYFDVFTPIVIAITLELIEITDKLLGKHRSKKDDIKDQADTTEE